MLYCFGPIYNIFVIVCRGLKLIATLLGQQADYTMHSGLLVWSMCTMKQRNGPGENALKQ